MPDALRPVLLLAVLGLMGAAIVAPLVLREKAIDADALKAEAQSRARAARPERSELGRRRSAELDAGTNTAFDGALAKAHQLVDMKAPADKVAAAYRRALILKPRHFTARLEWAQALLQATPPRSNEAGQLARKLIRDNPNSDAARMIQLHSSFPSWRDAISKSEPNKLDPSAHEMASEIHAIRGEEFDGSLKSLKALYANDDR